MKIHGRALRAMERWPGSGLCPGSAFPVFPSMPGGFCSWHSSVTHTIHSSGLCCTKYTILPTIAAI